MPRGLYLEESELSGLEAGGNAGEDAGCWGWAGRETDWGARGGWFEARGTLLRQTSHPKTLAYSSPASLTMLRVWPR